MTITTTLRATAAIALLQAVHLLAPLPAGGVALAGAYKCVDGDGNTTYSQSPCPAQDTTVGVLSSGRSKGEAQDCRIARNFAYRVADRMKSGNTADDVFNQYGGINALPATSVSLINYVFSHKGNVNTSVSRITALTMTRCQAGSFGETSCDSFPYSFVAELGGCDAAIQPQYGANGGYSSARPVDPGQPSAAYASHLSAREAAAAGVGLPGLTENQLTPQMRRETCRNRIEEQMDTVLDQMRGRNSAAGQNQLRERRRSLRKQLSRC